MNFLATHSPFSQVLCGRIKADFIIVDGFIGEEGLAGGIRHDRPIHMDTVIAGYDPVAVDTVCSKIMGIDPEKVQHLKWAAEKGIGTMKNVELRGLKIEEVARKFRTPIDQVNEEHEKIKIHDFGSCSGCHGRVATIVNHIEDSSLQESVDVYVGPRAVLPDESRGIEFFIGDCMKPYVRDKGVYIGGCPPTIQSIKNGLEKRLKIEIGKS